MDLTIGPYTFRLEILLLLVILFWVMCAHVLYGCSKITLAEGFNTLATLTGISESFTKDTKEGFVGANKTETGPEFSNVGAPEYIMNPSKWDQPTLTYSPGTTPDAGVKEIWDRPKQPIPLPEGQLDMFADTKFSPECCPNAYSSSTGCACMTVDQYNYLRDRGGNNYPSASV